MRSSLSKKERLLKRADFVDIHVHGRRIRTENFTIIAKANGLDITRLGLTVSKRIGNSVKRNRVKRLIRESFRLHKQAIPKGYDVVIITLHEIEAPSFSKVNEELGNALVKHGELFS
jgi:ribonuclease P protein component